MDIQELVNITSRAWALDILACLARGVPGRKAALLAATGAGRTAFSASLEHLIALGLLERNPGHGHPLRPEFRLTDRGRPAAVIAQRVKEALPAEPQTALLRRSWTLPILSLTREPMRFSGIKEGLGHVTDRALSQALNVLETNALMVRTLELEQRVPFPLYQAINAGNRISRVLNAGL